MSITLHPHCIVFYISKDNITNFPSLLYWGLYIQRDWVQWECREQIAQVHFSFHTVPEYRIISISFFFKTRLTLKYFFFFFTVPKQKGGGTYLYLCGVNQNSISTSHNDY